MSIDRLTRVNELIKREVAENLFHVMHESGFDLSAVTVTHVITSTDLRHARVLVSIRADPGDRPWMVRMLNKHAKQFQHHLGKSIILKYTPQIVFELDESIEKGDRILRLISELEEKQTAGGQDAP